jgi:hypothetical protein
VESFMNRPPCFTFAPQITQSISRCQDALFPMLRPTIQPVLIDFIFFFYLDKREVHEDISYLNFVVLETVIVR